MRDLHKTERSNVIWKYWFDIVKKLLIISIFYISIYKSGFQDNIFLKFSAIQNSTYTSDIHFREF